MKYNLLIHLLITPGLLATTLQMSAQTAPAQPDPWPRVFIQGGATNTLYQPQVDSWDGFLMKARAAVAIQPVGSSEPVFGVVELSARTLVDKDQRTVQLDQIQITSAKFPSAPDREPAYLEQLRRVLPTGARTIALDRLEANLAILEESKKGQAVPIQNQPPRIIVSQQAALLVLIDGAPAWRPVEGTSLQRVLNTRVLLLEDPSGRCYLHLWDGYLEAASLDGPWSVTQTISSDLKKAAKLAGDSGQVDLLPAQEDPDTKKTPSLKTTVAPVIYIATGPADLILIDGTPNWVNIAGTMLLYVANTASDVFKNINDQQTYLLLSGRWFRAPSFDGPWQYVPGESLPPDFANMPDTSPKENVKASIPGTPQAQEMVIANSIPQTAEIQRDAKLDLPPQVDGTAQLQPIASTPLSYVVNSPTPIIRVDDRSWYVCQNGVWLLRPFVRRPLDGRHCGAAGDLFHTPLVPGSLCHVCAHLDRDNDRGVCRLHAGLSGRRGQPQRRGGLRHRLLLHAVGRHRLRHPAGHLWLLCRAGLVALDGLGFRFRDRLGSEFLLSWLLLPPAAAVLGTVLGPLAWRLAWEQLGRGRGLGPGGLGGGQRQHLPPLRQLVRDEPRPGRLQRFDREPMGHAIRPCLQFAHRHHRRRPARGGAECVYRQLRLWRTRRSLQPEHRRRGGRRQGHSRQHADGE